MSISTFCFFCNLSAQYYVSDVDPVYLKWKKIVDKKRGNIIFPYFIEKKAMSISFFRDTLSPIIDYNIGTKMRRFPITVHPTNVLSNGMATYTPQRMELYSMPSRDNYSLPWTKQLVAHEYRHVAQMSNLNQGFTKVLSYVIGEQMLGLAAALIPTYFYEGDAVVAETQLAMFGRGKQPSFNIALRADLAENKTFSSRKYRLGTLNSFTPDSYLLGYYLTQYATDKYGDDFWSKVLRYSARNPYLIDPDYFAYRKYGNKTSSRKLIDSVTVILRKHWSEQSSVENSSTIIPTKVQSYTTYAYPLSLGYGKILSRKNDLDRSGRFVVVDEQNGDEKVLFGSGYITSDPVLVGDIMYWGEVVKSLSWGQKNSASIFYAKIGKDGDRYKAKRKRIKTLKGNYFFFTPYRDGGFVAVEYDSSNNPHIIVLDGAYNEQKRYSFTDADMSFNGLTYDSVTDRIYGVIVDDRGTSIFYVDTSNGELDNVMPPSYGTITDVTARDGKLYYTSIDSGKEEVHCYDLVAKKQYQLTTSKYGSQASSVAGDSILMTTYTADGYMLAKQKIELNNEREWQKMPSDILDYPFKKWDVPKLDTINFIGKEAKEYSDTKKVKRYNKALNIFNVHSWLPFYLNTADIIDGNIPDVGIGLYAYSQNLLNSVIIGVGYGRIKDENLWQANVKYSGLPVHIEANMEYGGRDQNTYNFMQIDGLKKHFEATVGLSLPLNLSSGTNNRFFRVGINYKYENALLYTLASPSKVNDIGGGLYLPNYDHYTTPHYDKGVTQMSAIMTFQNTVSSTLKALNPRLGYLVQLHGAMNPTNRDFGTLMSLYGRVYLPGPFKHGSFTVEGATQYQTTSTYQYNQTILKPKGVDYLSAIKRGYAASLDYRVPICYPNWGVGSFLNFQRISMSGFINYSTNQSFHSKNWINSNSKGGSIIFDVNLLGIKNLFNIDICVYKPSDKRSAMIGMGVNLAL